MSNKIVLIRFSSRDHGNCAGIANFLKEYHNGNVVDFKIDNDTVIPCGNCNYECLAPDQTCPNMAPKQTEVMDAICSADHVYYIIPNYCGFPPASYYAFNERSVGYFNKDRELMGKYRSVPKKFIIVSNTEGINFESAIKSQVNIDPEMIYLKTSKYKKISTAGDIMESCEARDDLRAFLDGKSSI